jgi:hypothetical protein
MAVTREDIGREAKRTSVALLDMARGGYQHLYTYEFRGRTIVKRTGAKTRRDQIKTDYVVDGQWECEDIEDLLRCLNETGSAAP